MNEFLSASLSYPAVLLSVLLGVVFVYWALVIIGAVGLDLLGASDGLDIEVGGESGSLAEVAEAPSAFRLSRVPLTVALSLLIFWSWLANHLGTHYLLGGFEGGARFLAGTGLLVGGVGVGFLLTKLCVLPLGSLFKTHHAARRQDLVGKVVSVRTGRVDRGYGQALLDDGSNALLLEVRCDAERELSRGQRVLIISVDDAHGVYEVEPLDELLGEELHFRSDRTLK